MKLFFDHQKFVTFSAFLLAYSTLHSGCSILVGSVKPVDQSAVKDQHKVSFKAPSEWTPIEISADQAWESKSGSVIALSSACRDKDPPSQTLEEQHQDLIELLREFKVIKKKQATLSGFTSIVTQGVGRYDSEIRFLEAWSTQSKTCAFDIFFLSNNPPLAKDSSAFQEFRDTLRYK